MAISVARFALVLLALVLPVLTLHAQRTRLDKLSPMLRNMARQEAAASRGTMAARPTAVCAFVKVAKDGEKALGDNGCRVLAQVGDICIAHIPTSRLAPLSRDSRIKRIEANRGSRPQTDSLAWYLNALPVYQGLNAPQAYTGKGVVVGVMDIGFDLTHPNFYSCDTAEYRIKRFWDMLSADTVGSTLYVGRDYGGRDELLAVAHARDGLDQTHGTHTLGIAAGSGYDSPYRGMAPESDICLVANAVSEDIALIDSADYNKYTYATDALGFKYIFDYAESRGMPCVINFSEGSSQDFWGYDQLYYELLERITGPGRIIVSSAGNHGYDKTWIHKAAGESRAGSFVSSSSPLGMLTVKADRDFMLRLVAYGETANDTLLVNSRSVVEQEDSVLNDFVYAHIDTVHVSIEAYPSCYVPTETCYDITFEGKRTLGVKQPLSVEVIGQEADIEVYRVSGKLVENALNPQLNDGELTHTVMSPATAPCVICVGATFYRPGIVNYLGQWKEASKGPYGERQVNSSIGPTMDGRIKPDVMAPGMNIISSYSSYYLENHPDANDIKWDVEHFSFNGRTYAWNTNSGTSMSSPAVAGAIALWLQAKPDLTKEQILDIFSHTCRHYDETMTFPNNYYGYGEIDVYSGLLYLLGTSGIQGVSASKTTARISTSEGRMTIDFGRPVAEPVVIRLLSLSGRQVMSEKITTGLSAYTMTLPHLAKGVYLVQIDGPTSICGSMLVRL